MSTIRLEIRVSKQSIMAFNPVKRLKQSSLPRIGQSPRKVKLDLLPQLLLWSHSPCWDHLGARTWCLLTLTSVLNQDPTRDPMCQSSLPCASVLPPSSGSARQGDTPVQTHLPYHQAQSVALFPLFFEILIQVFSYCEAESKGFH